MSDSEHAQNRSDTEALRALEVDVSELERIESLLNRFNVFEAIGFVGQEIKHSRFLAFLLDPKQSHGLGDLFLKRFLQESSAAAKRFSLPLAFESIDDRNLDQTTVTTEAYTDDGRIDILLLNEVGEWAMIIENKIRPTEHSDQLNRYYNFMQRNFSGWQIFGSYLTPHGTLASLKQKYRPLSYGPVCEIVDSILEDRGTTLNSDVRMSMEHYTQMVRRHILGGNFEIAKLCSQVYWKHQQAIDLVYKHRFAHQDTIFRVLQGLIEGEKRLDFDRREPYLREGEDFVAFILRDWNLPALRVANEGYSDSGLVLVFWFANRPNTLDLFLELGPGDEVVRKRLFNMARRNPEIFKKAPDSLGEYTTFFSRSILEPEFYKDATYRECEQEIRRHWREFLREDLPKIEAALKQETWIWEPVDPDPA